ncbi:MAG TPA: HAMP domain-containing sensor histidine kinase [Polyangiaceae bacterium]|nr:HAMP domain-containing sensor histidine kinase [Polyangiaceae bacterium]
MSRPARGALVWRLYLLGFIQIALLAVAVVGVGHLIGRPPPPGPPPHMGPPPDVGPPHASPPGPSRPSPWPPVLTFLFSGLVIVGVGAFLTARWIVRPLEAISGAARQLGAGDLTARTGVQRSDELGDVGRAFDEMAERVQTLLLAERELLANVSHELRTPLARLRVALDIAGEAGADAGRVSMAEMASDLAEIEAIVEDILTATRLDIEQGRAGTPTLALHLEEVSPGTLCERAAERFRGRHPRRPLDVSLGEAADVRADQVLLRRVLDNLLENADKYSPDPTRPVALRTSTQHGKVVFEVVDRGIGIPTGDLPRVFDAFFRGDRSRARSTGGVGLGLTLARRIVEAHGGTIEITSTVGAGTTVLVALPPASVVPGVSDC